MCRTWLRSLGLVCLVLGALTSTACAARTINSVLADPSRYRNQEVTLNGTVVESFSVVGRGAYMLDDRTGRVWIVSEQGTPRRGARVEVNGTVREGFNLGPLGDLIRVPGVESGLVLVERSHKARD